MSTFGKRAREDKRNERARQKEVRRSDKRHAPRSGGDMITAAENHGESPSIEEIMHAMSGGGTRRSAATIPAKLFVGSLSDSTTSAILRAHFEPHGRVLEAVVITDRDTGATRNFGFVTMADRKDAPRVINALDHSELAGSRIVVNIATENR